MRLIFSNMEELPQFAFLMNAFRCSANETSILGKKGRQPGASNRFVHFLLGGCDTRWSNLRSWLYFYFYNTAQMEEQIESVFNWCLTLFFHVAPCMSGHHEYTVWTRFKYPHCFDQHTPPCGSHFSRLDFQAHKNKNANHFQPNCTYFT